MILPIYLYSSAAFFFFFLKIRDKSKKYLINIMPQMLLKDHNLHMAQNIILSVIQSICASLNELHLMIFKRRIILYYAGVIYNINESANAK